MASLVKGAIALVAGREKIGLTGDYKGTKTTIDLDIVLSFSSPSTSTIAQYPIEKDASNPEPATIIDHVIPTEPTIEMDAILSDNLNLASSAVALSNKSKSAKDKLKTILYWQKMGSILTLEGYTTGKSGALSQIGNALGRGLTAFYSSKLDEPYYLGIDTDVIQNLVLSKITVKRSLELGENISTMLGLQRIKIAEAKTDSRSSKKTSGTKAGGKGNTPAAKTDANKPIHKSMAKK